MAKNPLGAVVFECGGQSYTFKLGTYAQALLERRIKTTTGKFFSRKAEDWGIDDLLSVFYAGLYREHRLSEERVADLMDELGGVRVGEIIKEGIEAANPDRGEVGTSESDPPKPSDGTGNGSINVG